MPANTKNNEMPFDFKASLENWEEATRTTTDQLIEATQASFDHVLALQERMVGMWMDNLKKMQELTIKESEAAFEMAESFQEQIKAAAERTTKMVQEN